MRLGIAEEGSANWGRFLCYTDLCLTLVGFPPGGARQRKAGKGRGLLGWDYAVQRLGHLGRGAPDSQLSISNRNLGEKTKAIGCVEGEPYQYFARGEGRWVWICMQVGEVLGCLSAATERGHPECLESAPRPPDFPPSLLKHRRELTGLCPSLLFV